MCSRKTLTCSSPPGRGADPRACDGGRAATAAPWPAAAARLTGRAWPVAGALQTWGAAGLRGAPAGMECLLEEDKDGLDQRGPAPSGQKAAEGRRLPHRRRGAAASRVRVAADR